VIGFVIVVSAAPARALSGKLGAQFGSVGNKLTGELPGEGKWLGRADLGYGLVAEVNLAADIALSFQPAFSPRNTRQEFIERDEVVATFDYEIDYLSLPLMIRVTGDPIGTRGFVTAGLDLNILLDATIDVGIGEADITDIYQSTTLGALFGAGVMVPVGRHFLTCEIRYTQGLEDMIVRDGDESEAGLDSPSVKYRGLTLMVGFLFSLGGD